MEEVGSVYLHVSNSGVKFTVEDGQFGPTVKISTSSLGNLEHGLTVYTTQKGLDALAALFKTAAAHFYRKPYCHAARPPRQAFENASGQDD